MEKSMKIIQNLGVGNSGKTKLGTNVGSNKNAKLGLTYLQFHHGV